jgi:predicted  nucleic acid-binding Zn-ribbon protein
MYFTNEQKKMINYINDRRVATIYDLIPFYKVIEKVPDDGKKVDKKISLGKYLFIIKENEIPEITHILATIDSICKRLQSKTLITILENKIGHSIPFCAQNQFAVYKEVHELNSVIEKMTINNFVATPELDEFIKNDYETEEEMEITKEREARKEAEKNTRRIAIFSIIANLIMAMGTTTFNYFTYNKEREMIIKDPGEKNFRIEIQNMDKVLEATDVIIETQKDYFEKIDEILKMIYEKEIDKK